MKYKLTLFLVLLLSALTTAADKMQFAQIDSLFAAYTIPGSPGCVVGVVQNGELIFAKGYGLAVLENDVPLSENCVLDIGSNAKQFTATCILLLEEQGKLKLDDELRAHIPEFPVYEKPVTLRHLMQHTSGIRDYFDLMTLKGLNIGNNYPNQEYFDLIFSQKELNFLPGEQHLYSNSGYILLAEVVRRVSGNSLAEFANEYIFQPLGMSGTLYYDNPYQMVKNRTGNYGPQSETEYWRGASIATNIGDGGILSTVGDLAKWDENFYQNRLGNGNSQLLRALERRTVLNSGDTLQWALGLRHDSYQGRKVVRHGGAYYGFRSEIARFPEEHLTVIILANIGTIDATGSAFAVADIFLPLEDSVELNTLAEQDRVVLSEKELSQRTGRFRNPVTGTVWEISSEDSVLAVTTSTGFSFKLIPLQNDQFKPTGINLPGVVRYSRHESSEFTIELTVEGQQTARFQPFKPDSRPITLADYVGEFKCRELELTFIFSLEGDTLSYIKEGHTEHTVVVPTLRDEFFAQGEQTQIRFERNESDSVRAMRLSLPRAKNIFFEKRAG